MVSIMRWSFLMRTPNAPGHNYYKILKMSHNWLISENQCNQRRPPIYQHAIPSNMRKVNNPIVTDDVTLPASHLEDKVRYITGRRRRVEDDITKWWLLHYLSGDNPIISFTVKSSGNDLYSNWSAVTSTRQHNHHWSHKVTYKISLVFYQTRVGWYLYT